MPSTPYAKLLIDVNGAGPTSGGITASPGDTIQFTAESTAQWDLTVPPRWEIYAYPPGWTGPASGWTTESVPQPGGGSADVYVYLGLGPTPSFTLPALPMWGKFLPKLTVNGGLLNGALSTQLVDNTSGIQTIGPNGLLDVAVGEEGQFDNVRSWVGPLQDDLRLLDAALAGAASPYTSTPAAIVPSAGSAGAINQYARGDHVHPIVLGAPTTIAVGDAAAAGAGTTFAGAAHVHALPAPATVAIVTAAAGTVGVLPTVAREDHTHQVSVGSPVNVGTANSDGVSDDLARADHVHALSFATLNSILATANAAITVNGQTVTSGGFIAPYFATSSTPRASDGLVRGIASQLLVVARNDGDSTDLTCLAMGLDGTDVMTVGSTSNAGIFFLAGDTAEGMRFDVGAVNVANWNDDVLGFFVTAPSAGGGDKLLVLGNATTAPTSVAASTIALWSGSSSFRALAPTNVLTVLSTSLAAGTGAGEDLRAPDRKTTRITTTNATGTLALSLTLAEKSVVDFTATIVAYSVDGPSAARIKVTGGAYRPAGGSATILGTNDTSAKATAGAAAWSLVVTTSGNDIEARVQGAAATTINWFVQLDANYMGLP
jgi:hypothetical protein